MTARLPNALARASIVLLAACSRGDGGAPEAARTPAAPARYAIGHPVDSARLASFDVDVDPSGHGLPAGSGTPAQGAIVYAQKCASCHGAKAEGQATYPKLVGRDPRVGFPFANDFKTAKTVGNYWPYATTLYDYVRRAMPFTAPGSLTPDETYAVVAYLLAQNEIVAPDAVMDARSLAAVKMPAAGHFVDDDRRGGRGFR
jgi:mono/diheme cytochrome c family protein